MLAGCAPLSQRNGNQLTTRWLPKTNAYSRKRSMNITLSPQVTLQELDNEAVLLDRDGEAYYGLDEVGMRL